MGIFEWCAGVRRSGEDPCSLHCGYSAAAKRICVGRLEPIFLRLARRQLRPIGKNRTAKVPQYYRICGSINQDCGDRAAIALCGVVEPLRQSFGQSPNSRLEAGVVCKATRNQRADVVTRKRQRMLCEILLAAGEMVIDRPFGRPALRDDFS